MRSVATGTAERIEVRDRGAMPARLRDGRGGVAPGQFDAGGVGAREVLAKDDENELPPEAAGPPDRTTRAQAQARATLARP